VSVVTVGAPRGVILSATAPARHLCPFKNEKDEGTVTVYWVTEGRTLELHSLRRHLDDFAAAYSNTEISHEEYTQRVRDGLTFQGHLHGLRITMVVTNWDTAGMPVSCSI
jgi:NADPH-dependent 7-cyano-7-deazaguanine reductase QueF